MRPASLFRVPEVRHVRAFLRERILEDLAWMERSEAWALSRGERPEQLALDRDDLEAQLVVPWALAPIWVPALWWWGTGLTGVAVRLGGVEGHGVRVNLIYRTTGRAVLVALRDAAASEAGCRAA